MTTTQLLHQQAGSQQNCVNATSSSFKMTTGFVLGLFEGDGTVLISISRKPNNKTGYRVRLSFKITLHKKDISVLYAVKDFLGVGKVEVDNASNNTFRFVVSNQKDIITVIAPLLTDNPMVLAKRHNDVQLFLKAVTIVSQGLHNTHQGLDQIQDLNASLSGKMSKEERTLLLPTDTAIKDNWFQGFTMAEGSFYSSITNSPTSALGLRVIVAFDISQELCELDAVNRLHNFIGCGSVVNVNKQPSLRVQGRADLINIVLPFFDRNPLLGSKAQRLDLVKQIIDIMESNVPLTQHNITEISNLIAKIKSI